MGLKDLIEHSDAKHEFIETINSSDVCYIALDHYSFRPRKECNYLCKYCPYNNELGKSCPRGINGFSLGMILKKKNSRVSLSSLKEGCSKLIVARLFDGCLYFGEMGLKEFVPALENVETSGYGKHFYSTKQDKNDGFIEGYELFVLGGSKFVQMAHQAYSDGGYAHALNLGLVSPYAHENLFGEKFGHEATDILDKSKYNKAIDFLQRGTYFDNLLYTTDFKQKFLHTKIS